MVEQTTAFLSDLLPMTDVTEVEVSTSRARKVDISSRIQDYHARSIPPCGAEGERKRSCSFPTPNRASLRRVGEACGAFRAHDLGERCGDRPDVLPRAQQLRSDEVATLLSACLPAYYQSLASRNAHTRFDVTDGCVVGIVASRKVRKS